MHVASLRRLLGLSLLLCLGARTAVAGLDQESPTNPQAAVQRPASGGGGESAQRVFATAQADYYAGQWSLAIRGFESYIKAFPSSDRADDAQYYIGESWYAQGKFSEALAAYDRLIATYPFGDALPDAFYKRGLALEGLGQIANARESFAAVVKSHPTTDAGRLAKSALGRLDGRLGTNASGRTPGGASNEPRGFYLVLLLARAEPGSSVQGLSAGAMAALKDAREFLPFQSYQLIDTVFVRGSRSQTVRMQGPASREYSGTLDVGPTNPPSEQDVYVRVDLADAVNQGQCT